ncbi:MAG: efflux RND transporter periplasmic adaptor subunit [Rhodocyclaceae bacterium]
MCVAAVGMYGCGNQSGEATGGAGQSAPVARQSNGSQGGRAQPVTVTVTRLADVPLTLEAQGAIIALDDVDIRPQKNGTITQIHFQEGDELKRGQLLFTLDDRDDAANVKKAEANVVGAQAALDTAQRDLRRTQDLSSRNFVSPSALDAAQSKVDAANALLAQNRAAVEQARVSLSYAQIRAPFDGRAGIINVRPGSLVTSSATATALVKITRMNPIGVTFSVPENSLGSLLEALRAGAVKVSADAGGKSLQGEVVFVDSAVDRTSGTIVVKARLDNSQRTVWPGQYVTVKMVAGTIKNAVVLPAQAVINGPNGRLVYLVEDDHTVKPQTVEVVRVVNQEVVVKGIAGGVTVVLEGGQNLRPGAPIHVTQNALGAGSSARHRNGEGASAPVAEQSGARAGAALQ